MTTTIERRESKPARTTANLPTVTPRADVWETAEAAHLAIELPGVPKDGLDLSIESDRLTLTATSKDVTPDGRELRAEWRPTRYQRTFLLTEDADKSGIEAALRHGLLAIRIPRRAEKRPRSIPVSVATD